MSRLNAEFTIERLVDVLAETLASGESVFIRGFATFKVYSQKPRMARNIKNGTAVMIPARKAVKFIPGKDLKKELQK